MEAPVVLLIFNRPDTTRRVLAALREAKPSRLFVVADGPRPGQAGDAERCRAARAVADEIDWECRVERDLAESNLGCARRVASGLDWALGRSEEAIILEDDCVPHPTFFRFCQELLERHRDDPRVMAVSGDNFQLGRQRTAYSYYFSRFSHCWGWATWSRAWRHYDPGMSRWPEVRQAGLLEDILEDRRATDYWRTTLDAVHAGRIDSWAYRWMLACWLQNGLTALPRTNLVSNIGFEHGATHTVQPGPFAALPAQAMDFPLRHPPFLVRSARADAFTQGTMFSPPGFTTRILNRLRRVR